MEGARAVAFSFYAFSFFAGLTFLATLISPDWVERLVELNPDGRDGAFEHWLTIVSIGCAAVSALIGAWAHRAAWRRS